MADSKPLISTFVFTKIHTTGRNWEMQPMHITEICMSAVLREYIETDELQPEEMKFMTLVRPLEDVCPEASDATGLTYKDLASAPTFEEIIDQLINYLNSLPKPVCLVACNGNSFDFLRLYKETDAVSRKLPEDLLTADFKWTFYYILKEELKGTKTKIPASLKDISKYVLNEQFEEEETAAVVWVTTMIACMMKRKSKFLMMCDVKNREFGSHQTSPKNKEKYQKRKRNTKKENEMPKIEGEMPKKKDKYQRGRKMSKKKTKCHTKRAKCQ